MTKKLSAESLKRLAHSEKFKSAAHNLMVCKKEAERIRFHVEPYLDEIFKQERFTKRALFQKGETEEVIMKRDLIYLADLDSEQVKKFDRDCWLAHREHSYDVPEGYCPLSIAQNEHVQAERIIIEIAAKELDSALTDIYGDEREKLLSILLEMASRVGIHV